MPTATETAAVDTTKTADPVTTTGAAPAQGTPEAKAGDLAAPAKTGADTAAVDATAAVDGKVVAAATDGAAAEGEGDDGTFLEEEGDGKPAEGKTKEELAAEAVKAGAWRDEFLKAEEARLVKSAGTDETKKKAVAADLARYKAQLGRYATVDAALAAGLKAQAKLREGLKIGLPENATPEEITAFREANGIPAEPAKYDIPAIPGHKWTEADEPNLSSFKETAHKLNLPQSLVNDLVAWQVGAAKEAVERRAEHVAGIDRGDKANALSVLREEYGAEFAPRVKLVTDRLLKDEEMFPDGSGKALFEARDAEGHRLVYNPAFMKTLVEMAVSHYGDGGLISGEQKAQSESEENELVALMKTDIDAFNYKPYKNTGMTGDARLLEIRRGKAARAAKGRAA